jgi:N-acetylglutamate synthase-like GNAT family acetyltransferase
MEIIDATIADIKYIDCLRAKESEALGFIPKVRYEMEITGERGGDIILAKENGDLVGFSYITYGTPFSAKIQQIAIQKDARRMERATELIDEIAKRAKLHGCAEIGCRCAEDLEANIFWEMLGFEKVSAGVGKSVYSKGKAKLGRRGRYINIYRKLSGLYEANLFGGTL